MGKKSQTPARTLEGRQNQLVNLAVDEAERRLKNGTASSQIITTLLHFASIKAQLELEKLRSDIALSKAKEKEIDDKINNADLYAQALNAFKYYKGDSDSIGDDDDD